MYTQYRAQRRALACTHQDIADDAGVTRTTVARELGIEPAKPMSLPLAQRLGQTLGFDPGYIALVHARDTMGAQARSSKHDDGVRQSFKRISAQLDRYVRKHYPFRIDDAGHRLAFRAARCRRQVSPEHLAHHSNPRDGVTPLLIRRYEKGLGSIESERLDALLAALAASSPHAEPITTTELDRLSENMTIAHAIADTIEWRSYKNTTLCGHKLYCPVEQGNDISVGVSPTLWNAMEVKLIRVAQATTAARTRVHITGMQQKGVQIGVLVQGKLGLTLSATPFSDDDKGRRARPRADHPDVLYERTCTVGDVVVAPGNHYYRLEFQARSCLLAIIGWKENVFINEPM